jgi:hypothetical protein
MKKKLGLLLISCIFLVQTGCIGAVVVGAGVGAGTVIYIKGSLEQQMNASVKQVYSATLAALNKMGLPVVERQRDEASASIKSRFADGTHIWINISAITNSVCELKIRVGTFGDEQKSRMILDEIQKRL